MLYYGTGRQTNRKNQKEKSNIPQLQRSRIRREGNRRERKETNRALSTKKKETEAEGKTTRK